jgi:hypothetical protein
MARSHNVRCEYEKLSKRPEAFSDSSDAAQNILGVECWYRNSGHDFPSCERAKSERGTG